MCKGETHEPFRTYPFREKADDLRCTQTLLYITRTSTFSAEQEFRPSYPLERGFLYNIRRRGKRPRLRRQDFSLHSFCREVLTERLSGVRDHTFNDAMRNCVFLITLATSVRGKSQRREFTFKIVVPYKSL